MGSIERERAISMRLKTSPRTPELAVLWLYINSGVTGIDMSQNLSLPGFWRGCHPARLAVIEQRKANNELVFLSPDRL